jgi:glycosyltransferase involved in cell wall biosynthesis
MKRLPRILHVTTVHAAGDTRLQKEISALLDAGFDVTLAAPFDGTVEKLPPIPFSPLPKPATRTRRMLTLQHKAFSVALRYDAIHFHDPELLPLALVLLMSGKKVVYDIHEDYAAQIQDKTWLPLGVRRFAARGVRLLERFFLCSGGLGIAATPHIASLFPKHNVTVVRNVPELARWMEPEPFSERSIPVSYVGEIRPVRGAFILQRVAELLHRLGISLTVAGRMADMTDDEKHDFAKTPGMNYLGPVPYANAIEIIRKSRVGLVPFLPASNNKNALPTKILEYLAAGTLLVVSDFPVWRRELGASGAVSFADPASPEQFVERCIGSIEDEEAEHRSALARSFVEQDRNWEQEKQKLIAFYKAICI